MFGGPAPVWWWWLAHPVFFLRESVVVVVVLLGSCKDVRGSCSRCVSMVKFFGRDAFGSVEGCERKGAGVGEGSPGVRPQIQSVTRRLVPYGWSRFRSSVRLSVRRGDKDLLRPRTSHRIQSVGPYEQRTYQEPRTQSIPNHASHVLLGRPRKSSLYDQGKRRYYIQLLLLLVAIGESLQSAAEMYPAAWRRRRLVSQFRSGHDPLCVCVLFSRKMMVPFSLFPE